MNKSSQLLDESPPVQAHEIRDPRLFLEDVVDSLAIHGISLFVDDRPGRFDLLLSAIIIDPCKRHPLLAVEPHSKIVESRHRYEAARTGAITAISN